MMIEEENVESSDLPGGRPGDVSVQFLKRSGCDAARYVSDTTVREEALDQGRLTGVYWSAVDKVIRDVGPGRHPHSLLVDALAYPVAAFELEIDGQALHSHWQWVGAGERPAARPGTVEAVVELRHGMRPVTIKVVTRLDGTPFLARWIEIANTGSLSAALSGVSPCRGKGTRQARVTVNYSTDIRSRLIDLYVEEPLLRYVNGVTVKGITLKIHGAYIIGSHFLNDFASPVNMWHNIDSITPGNSSTAVSKHTWQNTPVG